MNQQEKQDFLKKLGGKAAELTSSALKIDSDQMTVLFRSAMPQEELLLWDLMTYWENEALRCVDSGAHFSAMICSVSMNEALLCYLCLICKEEVMACPLYRKVGGGRKQQRWANTVGDWKLKTLLEFASQLEWMPADLIDANMAKMMVEVLTEMRQDPLPSDFTFSTEEFERLLISEPGKGLVELTQSLRNYVHPTRWLRLQKSLSPVSFTLWCEVATRLSGEIRNALLLTAVNKKAESLAKRSAKLPKMDTLTEPERALVGKVFSELVRQRAGISLPSGFDPDLFSAETLRLFI